MKKKILSAILVVTMVLGLVGCNSSTDSGSSTDSSSANSTKEQKDTPKKDTLRYAVVTGNPSHWLGILGQKEGFFEKYNLNVELQDFAAGVNTADAVALEQADIGYLSDYAVLNRLGSTQNDTTLRIIANFGTENQNLYVNPEEVSSLEDIAGKGFLTIPGSVRDYYTARTLEIANIPEKKRKIVNVEDQQMAIAAFKSGDGVAFWTGGTGGAKLEEAGMVKLMDISDLGLQNLSFYIAPEKFVNENTDKISRFLQAIKETQDWLLANPEEAADVIYDEINISQDVFLGEQTTVSWTMSLEKDSLDYLNEMKEWLIENNELPDFEITDFINTDALESVFPENVTYK